MAQGTQSRCPTAGCRLDMLLCRAGRLPAVAGQPRTCGITEPFPKWSSGRTQPQSRSTAGRSRSAEDLRPCGTFAEVVSSTPTQPQSRLAACSTGSAKDLQHSRTFTKVVSSGRTQPQSRLTAGSTSSAEDLRPHRTFAEVVSSGRPQPHLPKLSSAGRRGGGSIVLASSRSTLPLELDKEKDRGQLTHGRALNSGRALKRDFKAGSPV